MVEFLNEALASGPFLPHGHCYLWIPTLVWLHVASDALIALAYFVLSIGLVYFVYKRRDLPFRWIFLMFGAFIVACGMTHLMGVWNLWYPTYWATGAVKATTAAISLASAVLLVPLVPRALTIPSPAQLEAMNHDLEGQVHEREHAEAALLEARDELEHRVQQRTAELTAANAALQAEIAERRQAEDALRNSEALLRAILSTAADGIITIDEHSLVQSFNPAAERLFGYAAQEVIGHGIAMLMPSPYREEHPTYVANYLRTGQAKILGTTREVAGQRKDGIVFPLEISVSEVRWGDRRMFTGIVRDLTERRGADEAVSRAVIDTMHHAAQLRSLAGAALAINSALSVDEVLQVITEQARAIIGAHQSATRLTVDQDWTQASSAISLSNKYAAWQDYDVHLDGSGIYALVCRDNQPMRLTQEELEAHPGWRGFGKEKDRHPPMRGWLAGPLIGRDGRNMGLLQLSDKYEGEFTENDESVLVQLAQMAAVSLENARLIGEVQQAEEQLKRQLQFTKSITDSLGEGVYAVDHHERVTFVNPAAQAMLGWTEAELLGQLSHDIMRPRRTDGTTLSANECELRSVLTGEVRLQRGEVALTRKDGTVFPVMYASSSIEINEAFVGAVVAFHDITEREQAEEAIKNMNVVLEQGVIERTAQLEATNHELETFSYSVSHDLRAPLRGIDGFSQALLEDYAEQLDAEGQEYLHRIRSATQRMAELIDALLALSRLTRTELQRDTVDLSHMARAIAADLQQQAPDRHVEWSLADDLMAYGDARLLRVALENLLGNAWKFTANTPAAHIAFGKSVQDDGTEAFFVADNGAGFDMAYADKLFGAFQRLHRANEFPGTGIGLATVQRIIHRHGGRVWAQGRVNEGATIYFTL